MRPDPARNETMLRRRAHKSMRRSIGRRIRAGVGPLGRAFAVPMALLMALASGGATALAQDMVDQRLEYNVKAVSLYAFGRYVTWPDSAFESTESPFVIGVFGGNPFGDALDRIAAKKSLGGRSIAVRLLKSPSECVSCHIVFVSRTVEASLQTEIIQTASGKPILLVGESPGFVERGGIINFYQSGSNVRFELNPDKGVEARLSLNAKLLTLGTKASTRQ